MAVRLGDRIGAGVKRILGVKNYRSVDAGLREIGQSAGMGAETLRHAQRIAGNAEAVGRGSYAAQSESIRYGRPEGPRAGAVAYESQRHWDDVRNSILVRTADAMAVRRT